MWRRAMLLLVLALPILGTVLVVWVLRSGTEITPENAARLKEGMTELEVEFILGGPSRHDVYGVVLVGDPPTKAMGGDPDRQAQPGTWLSDRAYILILFDDNGLVRKGGIFWWPTRPVEESVRDKVFRWFHL